MMDLMLGSNILSISIQVVLVSQVVQMMSIELSCMKIFLSLL